MKRLLLALCLLASTAFASDATMVADCEFQMARGVCSVKLDRTAYGAATRIFVSRRWVQVDAMLLLQNSDNTMCEIASRACAAGAQGTQMQQDICHIARSRWKP